MILENTFTSSVSSNSNMSQEQTPKDATELEVVLNALNQKLMDINKELQMNTKEYQNISNQLVSQETILNQYNIKKQQIDIKINTLQRKEDDDFKVLVTKYNAIIRHRLLAAYPMLVNTQSAAGVEEAIETGKNHYAICRYIKYICMFINIL